MRMRARRRARGTILVITLLVLLILTAMGVAMVSLAGFELDVSGNVRAGEQALYNADYGLQKALAGFDANGSSGAIPNGFGATLAQVVPPLPAEYEAVLDDSGAAVANSYYRVVAEMDAAPNPNGGIFTIECNIPEYPTDYGRRRYHLISTGLVSGATRQVEAVILSMPLPGLCPPGMGEQHP